MDIAELHKKIRLIKRCFDRDTSDHLYFSANKMYFKVDRSKPIEDKIRSILKGAALCFFEQDMTTYVLRKLYKKLDEKEFLYLATLTHPKKRNDRKKRKDS
jgi:hypothetical protein